MVIQVGPGLNNPPQGGFVVGRLSNESHRCHQQVDNLLIKPPRHSDRGWPNQVDKSTKRQPA